MKAKIKKEIAKRFASNPFAHKYKETLAARELGRHADKVAKGIPESLKRKHKLAKKIV